DRRLPLVTIDEVVPVGDQVVDRTALVTERNAAIHAACSLVGKLRFRQRLEELGPRLAPDVRLVIATIVPLDLEESGWLAHRKVLSRQQRLRPPAVQLAGRAARAGSRGASPSQSMPACCPSRPAVRVRVRCRYIAGGVRSARADARRRSATDPP